MQHIISALEWRYATKQFDPSKKVQEKDIDILLEALRLAPSSFGLQPWKFVVVTNPEVRATLREAGYNQPQITDASHLIVFAVEKNIDDAFVDRFVRSISETRGVPETALEGYAAMMKGAIAAKTPEQRIDWAARQAYLALGVLVTAGALMNIDITPMEGFDPKKFDEILELDKKGLASQVIAVVGYRMPDDPAAAMKKVRYPKEQMVIEVT